MSVIVPVFAQYQPGGSVNSLEQELQMARAKIQAAQNNPNAVNNEIDMISGAGASATAPCVAANNCFSPNPLYVSPGTTVTWRNTDTVSHYVTSGKSSDATTGTIFDSGNLIKPGATFQFTFATAGAYDYYCTVHPWVSGQVIVGSGGQTGSNPNANPTTTQQPYYYHHQSQSNSPNDIDVVIALGAGASASARCVSTNNCFNPNPLSVDVGHTVTWLNGDQVSHTVTSGLVSDSNTGSLFDSGLISPGKTFQFTFANPGTYNYFCTVHPWMLGQVLVGQGSQSTPNQVSSSITVTTENTSYTMSDSIVVSGTVNPVDSINPQRPVMIQTYDGNDQFLRV